jgi:hypothetical protein
MTNCKPAKIPLDHGCKLSKDDGPQTPEEKDKMSKTPYRELVGALIWISLISRPDIAFAARYLSRFSSNPGPKHWKAAQQVLRYLAGTIDLVQVLGGKSDNALTITGYSDSSGAEDLDDRKATTGCLFQLGDKTIVATSKKQPTVGDSSVEREYMAAAFTTKYGLWLINLMEELKLSVSRPVTIYVDNTGTIDLSKDSRFHPRTKHIDIKHHFIRERVNDGTFIVTYLPSDENTADLFTKPLNDNSFHYLQSKLSLISLPPV